MEDLATLAPVEFTRRIHELLAKACPDKESESFLNRNMAAAKLFELT